MPDPELALTLVSSRARKALAEARQLLEQAQRTAESSKGGGYGACNLLWNDTQGCLLLSSNTLSMALKIYLYLMQCDHVQKASI